MMMRISLPGFQQFRVGRANALVANGLAQTIHDILTTQSLYQYAAAVPDKVTLHGRAPVYIIPMAGVHGRVAVRHAMRGGWIARITKDRFLPPTRGLRELVNTLRLRMVGIPSPDVLGIVSYAAGGPFRRSDVVTRYVEDGADLAAVFGDARNDAERRRILDAVARLLAQMTAAGVQHPDLNLKNILITAAQDGYTAHLLDVDRVHFHVPNDPMVARANLDRLLRSLTKWRNAPTTRRDALSESDFQYLTLGAAVERPATS
jgi:hypothetical protein